MTDATAGENVNHPPHYGGGDNPHEHVKCAEAAGLTAHSHLYNATKYIWRAGKKGNRLEDLKKAQWYLHREIANECVNPTTKHPPYSQSENDWRGLYERQRMLNLEMKAQVERLISDLNGLKSEVVDNVTVVAAKLDGTTDAEAEVCNAKIKNGWCLRCGGSHSSIPSVHQSKLIKGRRASDKRSKKTRRR